MSLRYIHAPEGRRLYRAKWVVVSAHRILENACVETENGRITDVYSGSAKAENIQDLGHGVILPFLVNAHLHLELSALKGKLVYDQGFEAWVGQLLAQREVVGEEGLKAAAERETRNLKSQGTGAIGEISTLGITREMVADAGLTGVWFKEFLGPGLETLVLETMDGAPASSLAGHAPHTTSPELLQALKEATRKKRLPFSIHLAESRAESDFIMGNNPGWQAFLESRGIDVTGWPIGNRTPVAYLHDLGLLDTHTLAVHLLDVSKADVDILARTRTQVCICPRSNENLHGKLPDIPQMLAKGITPALGTDSLASCDSLNLFDEMAFMRKRFANIGPEHIFSMATVYGARALGLGASAGHLGKGAMAQFLYLDMESPNPDDLLERLTRNEF